MNSLIGDQSADALELRELESCLQNKLGGRVRDLQLVPHPAGVVLRGLTRTFYVKQLAQQTFMSLTQVPIHANEITVS